MRRFLCSAWGVGDCKMRFGFLPPPYYKAVSLSGRLPESPSGCSGGLARRKIMDTLEKREELSLNNNLLEALNAMTEGNIGAITVMWEMLTRSEPAIFLFELCFKLLCWRTQCLWFSSR